MTTELMMSIAREAGALPHPASLGYRLRSATLPENGEG
jgi:hypothetical protein